ncbi:MAG: hypothetical protein DI617_03430 [Streptococcus pyogenes]|nr:MAG: hypothetical protein DI617_03430 [Streptococcus pyogenes]
MTFEELQKFRVFSLENNEMWLANDYEELSELFIALDADDSLFSDLMQSTGLKDKNGVEIFENDIIRFDNGPDGFLNQVIFDKQFCAFKFKSLDNRWDDTYFSNFGEDTLRNLEVIGNIYENPDLLERVEE